MICCQPAALTGVTMRAAGFGKTRRNTLINGSEPSKMSTRCRNDLIGCSSRLQSTLSKWRESTALAEESWNDETARTFYTHSLGEVEPVISRMITSLQEAVDLVRTLEKKLYDSDAFE